MEFFAKFLEGAGSLECPKNVLACALDDRIQWIRESKTACKRLFEFKPINGGKSLGHFNISPVLIRNAR